MKENRSGYMIQFVTLFNLIHMYMYMHKVHVSSCVLIDIQMLYYLFMRFKVLKDKSDFS